MDELYFENGDVRLVEKGNNINESDQGQDEIRPSKVKVWI